MAPEAAVRVISVKRSAYDPQRTLARFCKMKKSLIQSGVLLRGGRRRTQKAGFLRSFSEVLFLLPLLFAHTADGDVNTELYEAAAADDTAEVEQLIRYGADVNAKQKNGWTALMVAAGRGRTESLKVLIDAGADVNVEKNNGQTALMVAADKGSTETIKPLIDAGADANAKYNSGLTAMMLAVGGGHTETLKALIEVGADVNAKSDRLGRTALMFAARTGQTVSVKTLIDAGADVNAQRKDGFTALMLAATSDYAEIVDILKQAGATQ